MSYRERRETILAGERTYTNPVHDAYLGDPFVLKHNCEYYAYGTAPLGDLTVPVLHSRDLVSWRPLGDALTLHDDAFEVLWAPEVAYDNGTFYMYYSAGGQDGQGHGLRVAVASHPAGPFEDAGVVLAPDEPFTIDAHPFRDDDGRWYLYYCRDFLDEENGRVGTGIVVDRLVGMTGLASERQTVVRPHADWQLYDREREWYGRVWDWYTAEGPFVREHAGRYYCFYSGGAWQEPNYGVSYVVAERPMGPFVPASDAQGPEILRTRPDRVIGPGHASIVRAPDNTHDYLVYHAWDPGHTRRLMRIDGLFWGAGGPRSPGPTLGPQPAPPLPTFRDNFDGPDGAPPDPGAWRVDGGDWRQQDGELLQRDAGARPATVVLPASTPGDYLLEANVRLSKTTHDRGRYGVCLVSGSQDHTLLIMLAANGTGLLCGQEETVGECLHLTPLGPDLDSYVYRRLLVRVAAGRAEVWVDGIRAALGLTVPSETQEIGLCTWGVCAAFDGVSLTLLPRQSPLDRP